MKRTFLFGLFFALLWLATLPLPGCARPCPPLAENYRLTGCEGEDTCTLTQTDCQIRFKCNTTFQECLGIMTNRTINMRCVDGSSASLQAVAGVRDDQSLQMTFVRQGKSPCQGELQPTSQKP